MLEVFERRMNRKIYGAKKDETWILRIFLYNKELGDLYTSV
jgi:hypothetical protein